MATKLIKTSIIVLLLSSLIVPQIPLGMKYNQVSANTNPVWEFEAPAPFTPEGGEIFFSPIFLNEVGEYYCYAVGFQNDQFYLYNITQDQWIKKANLVITGGPSDYPYRPLALSPDGARLCALADDASRIEIYDIVADNWTASSNPPQMNGVDVQTTSYVWEDSDTIWAWVKAYINNAWTVKCYEYVVSTDMWTQYANSITPAVHDAKCAGINFDKTAVFAGGVGGGEHHYTKYNISTDTYDSSGHVGSQRRFLYSADNDKLWYFFTNDTGNHYLDCSDESLLLDIFPENPQKDNSSGEALGVLGTEAIIMLSRTSAPWVMSWHTPQTVADFYWSPENPAHGENITFDASSSVGQIGSYNWDFGDNTTGAGQVITHSYQSAGDYEVTLSVTDDLGDNASTSKIVLVQLEDPPVVFEILRPDAPGDECRIPYASGNACPNHYLNVNDVTPDEDATKVYIHEPWARIWRRDLYNTQNLTSAGEINRVTVAIRYRRQGGMHYTRIAKSCLKTHGLVYESRSLTSGGSWQYYSLSYTTNPYTGQAWTLEEVNDLQIGVSLYYYRGVGWSSGGHCTQVYAVVEYTPGVAADFAWLPEDPGPGENITFDASGSVGEIVSYNWTFGDSTTGAGGNVTHAYQNVGDYIVTLAVSDNVGASDNISKVVSVKPWSFAMITDLHIGRGYPDYAGTSSSYTDENITGTEPELDYYLTERLNSAVTWINQNKDDPNHNIRFVAVLGDIADTAERSELLKAKRVLDRLNDPNGDGDTSDGIPYIPLFGNHDIWPYTDYEEAPETLIGQYFEDVFWYLGNNKNRELLESIADNFIRQEDELGGFPYFQNYAFRYKGMSYLGLDFVPREAFAFGPGVGWDADIPVETRIWLTEKLTEYQGQELVILLSHYPLIHDVSAFDYGEFIEVKGILEDYENIFEGSQFLGNFAGHIHGAEQWEWILGDIHANREYDPVAGAPVVTTEALMVGSNRENAHLINNNKGIIRIVKVQDANQIDYATIEGRYDPIAGQGQEFIALNPSFNYNNDGTDASGIKVSFYPEVFTQRDVYYRWDFGDNTPPIETTEAVAHYYSSPDNYPVTMTAVDYTTGVTEEFPADIPVEANITSYNVATSDQVTATSTTIEADLTQVGRSQKDTVLIGAIHSEAKPVGLITVHFEQAEQDIDLTAMAADYNFSTQKSVIHMPVWPATVEESKALFIPYSTNGTVYVCPNAASLDEVNPHDPDKVILEPEETVNGMTVIPVTYDSLDYYLVFGFANGGGAVNLPPIANASGSYVGEEGSPVTFTASNSTDPNGDPLQYRWDFNGDGTWDTDWLEVATANHTWSDDFAGSAILEVSDGELTDNATALVNITNANPIASDITASLDPVEVDTEISANATFTDPGKDDTHVAIWDWGDNTTSEGYIDETVGFVSGNHTCTAAGVYTVKLTITDDDNGSDESIFHYVVVYDPEGGFVTGGGWINSPEGAYAPDPTLTGKANLGFVSKYQQGQSTPSGNTQFNFKAGDLNFHSSSYDWLVIANHKATYKGTGTINCEGNYGFMLTAIDEALTPSTDVDLFRIKIWDKDTGEVIYDNQMGDEEDADPTTELGGGSIVIHEG